MRKGIKSILASVLSLAMVVSAGTGFSGVAADAKEVPAEGIVSTDSLKGADKTDASNLTEEHDSANGIKTKDNGQMRKDMTSKDFMENMGLGWNYGNSLEQSIDLEKLSDEELEKLQEDPVGFCETSANNLALTQKNVDVLKEYGFKNIRIPVAWSNLMDISEDGMTYTVNEAYMDRVEEVINYCLNDELYVIVNIHYDGDWWGQFGDEDESIRKMAWARYEQIWTQLAERYKEYSDRLIFESANEELGDRLNDDWRLRSTTNRTGVLTVDEQYETMNKINQKFVDIVRESGGNNTYRYLLIAGYSTNIERTCDDRFVMPTDLEENGTSKLSVSVHYYTPWNYCGGSEYHQGEGDAPRLFDWGTEEDIAVMHADLDMMSKFTDAGYGVIVGEFGVQTAAADGICKYITECANYCLEKGLCPVFWDNGSWFDRDNSIMFYDDLGAAIQSITGSTATFEQTGVTTGKPAYEQISDESGLTLRYTWEGEWWKNGGGMADCYCTNPDDTQGSFTFHCNKNYYYWAVIQSDDFAKYSDIYLRITCKDNDTDSSALQYASATYKSTAIGNLEKTSVLKSAEIPAEEEWSGKIFKLDPSVMKDQTILWISASNKPIITKIEIFADEAAPEQTASPVPSPAGASTPTPAAITATGTPTPAAIAAGDVVKVAGAKYQVVDTDKNTVEYKAPTSKKNTQVTIPAKVKINGNSYKVVSIAKNAFKNNKKLKKVTIGTNVTTIKANAFSGCSKLKTITVKSKKLKSIGKNAFKGIQKKAVFKVPKAKYKAYKKLLKAKVGFKKTMTIKKA